MPLWKGKHFIARPGKSGSEQWLQFFSAIFSIVVSLITSYSLFAMPNLRYENALNAETLVTLILASCSNQTIFAWELYEGNST